MKIAIQQMSSVLGDLNTNFKSIVKASIEASLKGAELLIVPELAPTGYGAKDALNEKAVTADQNGLNLLCKTSAEHNIAIVVGYSERSGDRVFNSAAFITNGKVQANYHKCQLWAGYEKRYFTAGPPSTVITNYKGLRIGMLICYDVEFPERVRALAKKGVDLIAVPTATPASTVATFIAEKMISVRAFENQSFIAYVNHHGNDGNFSYAGLSCIAAPDGTLIAQAEIEGDALLYADIDPSKYSYLQTELPYLKDLIEE